MVKYKIIYERKGCIGAGSCTAIAPKFWSIKEGLDMKADLQGSELDEFSDDLFIRIIDESDLQANLDAAHGCPAQVIHIINLDTGEKLI